MTDPETSEWPWPTGPGADRILSRQRELEMLLADRVPVFMDTNFWIAARQAATGEDTSARATRLLGALRMAVGSGRVFFPVTSDLIEEFSKQTPERLAATMMMVDLLSLGVAMIPHHERLALEIEAFFAKVEPAQPPVPRPIWTSFAFAFGYRDLLPPGVGADPSVLVELADRAWRAPPSLLASRLTAAQFDAAGESRRVADMLVAGEALHAEDVTSHAEAVRIEVAGVASMVEGIVAREYRRLAAQAGEHRIAADVSGSRATGRRIAGMLARALERDEIRRFLGSLFVPAMLHAAVRSEAGRKMRPNDLYDFRHAAAALPYCRAFLTERSLQSLISSGHVRLAALYGCRVISDRDEAIRFLGDVALGV